MSVETIIAELSAAKATLTSRDLDVTALESALESARLLRDNAQTLVDSLEQQLYDAV